MADERSKIRVLVVDDEATVRRGLCRLLDDLADIEVIADTEFGEEAVRIVQEQAPDVVLLDLLLNTSRIDGLETLKQITTSSPSTHVLVLSAHSQDAYVFPALRSGAIGYVLKRAMPEEVVEAIRDAAIGRYHLDPLIVKKIIDRLPYLSDDSQPVTDTLTKRERELLPLIARGLTNKEIADALTLSPLTVKAHVSNILRKLGVDRRSDVPAKMARRDLATPE